MKKRDLFAEMMQGVEEMATHREGKITLRQCEVEDRPAAEISAEEIVALRQRMHMSQPVFARRFRISTGTLRKWEQSQARPNAQAAVLFRLVEKYPDMMERLAEI